MKKTIYAAIAAVALTFGGGVAASATQLDPECVPADAYVEYITHPAIGEPTIIIDNPDYVPAVPAVTVDHPAETVDHPAVTVDHPAVTQTQWRYSQHGGNGFIWVDNDTYKYIKESGEGTNQKPHHGTFYERSQKTQTITISEAWTETISEAWTETVKEAWTEVVTEAIPAQGEPTIEVANPDYTAEWIEVVQHDAVICEEVPVEEPVDEPINVIPPVKQIDVPTTIPAALMPPAEVSTAAPGLAVTGSDDPALPILAFSAMGLGAALLAGRSIIRARKS